MPVEELLILFPGIIQMNEMIIGNGNIARVSKQHDREDVIFFASGCSDSGCTDEAEFLKEMKLIVNQDRSTHFVYFSNLGVYRWNSPYIAHKKKMEVLVKEWFRSYTIVRLEVCEWVDNPTTILNVFKRKIAAGEEIEIRDEFRSVLSLKDFHYWMQYIPVGQCNEMNIMGRLLHISEIVELIKGGKL